MSTTTDAVTRPSHPGQVLESLYLSPLGWSASDLASRIGMNEAEITSVVTGDRPVTTEMAARLAKLFGMRPQVWTSMQANYELSTLDAAVVDRIQPLEESEAA